MSEYIYLKTFNLNWIGYAQIHIWYYITSNAEDRRHYLDITSFCAASNGVELKS